MNSANTAVIEERRQFAALYRSFLFRVVDLEVLSASGDVRNLLAQFAALLAAYSFVLALFTVTHFGLSEAAPSKLTVGAWGLEEFYFSTTITVVGLFAVLSWNALTPDRRDGLVLDPLPVRMRTISSARGAAVATALGISVIAVNVFTGLSFPFIVARGGGLVSAVRCFAAYWATLAAAGLFAFGSLWALQGVAAMVLSYRRFQRISSVLQLFVLFGVLSLFFLTPPLASPSQLSLPANQEVLQALPSYWFLGLFQELNGTTYGPFGWLAWRAVGSVAFVYVTGLCAAGLTWARHTRRAIEQPNIVPGESTGVLSRLLTGLTVRVLRDPIDRAILLFSARTLARSRQHRLVLAVYIGIALAISLAYAKSLVYGVAGEHWRRPGVALLITGLVTLFFALVGSRAVFSLPYALPANWIFKITAVRSPAVYFAAVRKTLFVLGAVPVLCVAGMGYLAIWPTGAALQQLVVLTLLGLWLVQRLLRKFHKIPFGCSYLPGKSNLRLKLGIGGAVFLLAVDAGARIELWSMDKPARYGAVVALLGMMVVLARRRTAEWAGAPHHRVQFEDVPAADIFALDLRRDAEYFNESE